MIEWIMKMIVKCGIGKIVKEVAIAYFTIQQLVQGCSGRDKIH
jgi:hypothetical protein